MTGLYKALIASLVVGGLVGCSPEQRPIAAGRPITPPQAGSEDPRVARYQRNHYEVSQGGRYFLWYGCAGCHVEGAPPGRDLADRHWRHGEAFADVYRFIGHGHEGGAADDRTIPVEQLWQITAYVRSLPEQEPEMRRRTLVDMAGEPQGAAWSGPLR